MKSFSLCLRPHIILASYDSIIAPTNPRIVQTPIRAGLLGRCFRASPPPRTFSGSWNLQTSRAFAKPSNSGGQASQLLAKIQSTTQKYLAHLAAHSIPEPDFEHGDGLDPTSPLPADVQLAREEALEATDELHHLLLGPARMVMSCPGDQYLMLALQYILRHQIAHQVPTEGEISFDGLAQRTGLDARDIAQFLRVAIARHVFHEPRKGHVKHTAASKVLLANPYLENFINYCAQEIWPSITRCVDATQKWPGSEEPNQSGFSLAHHTSDNPFDEIQKCPARTRRFADGVQFSHRHSAYSMDHLLATYDFSQTNLLVDVGGSHGGVSITLASQNPHLTCIVQDLPATIAHLDGHVPANLRGRVTGMEHDFFTPQPVANADVFLLRWVLHDWSDKYGVKILRALIPALKRGARVLVNEVCLPEPGQLPIARERNMRAMDISMKAFNNARERDYDGWVSLFEQADPRFVFLGVKMAPASSMALVEVEWRG